MALFHMLTANDCVGMIVNVAARLIYDFKRSYDDGTILQVLLWELPQPVPGSRHRYKYRLYYGMPGHRIVGYDNERGKGDHRHYDKREEVYRFTTVDKLVSDFLADVAARRRRS